MRHNGIAAIVLELAVGVAYAQNGPVRLLFPPQNGIVYGRPHVLIIFAIEGSIESIAMKLDGREIAQSLVTSCKICAGNNSAILTSDVPWGATDGRHVLVVEGMGDGRSIEITRPYTVNSTRPSLSGLSGHVLLPNAFAGAENTAIVGGSWFDRKPRSEGFAGLAFGPFEASASTGPRSSFDWKAQLGSNLKNWSLARGELGNHPFGVISFRTEPPNLELTLGAGSGELPRGWLGASYVFTGLNRRKPVRGTIGDLLSISELVALEGEIDDQGRFNIGATLHHPYGWSVGLYRVNTTGTGTWRIMATLRFGFGSY